MGQIEVNYVHMLNWMFEIELFICLKMDSVLYMLEWLIHHKNKPNQTKSLCINYLHYLIILEIAQVRYNR